MKKEELIEAAIDAREELLKKRKTLTGYCYQNSEEMSKQLKEREIEHDLYVVGLIEDYLQGIDTDKIEKHMDAYKKQDYEKDYVPEKHEELRDEFKHYLILAKYDGKEIVVEPCTEVRNEELSGIRKANDNGIHNLMYIGEWPKEHYLKLKDSKIDKRERFKHFSNS